MSKCSRVYNSCRMRTPPTQCFSVTGFSVMGFSVPTALLCTLLAISCFLPSTLIVPNLAFAQEDAQMDKGLDFLDDKTKEAVKRRIKGARQEYDSEVEQLGPKIKQFMNQNAKKSSASDFNIKGGSKALQGQKFPKKHPLLESKGVANTSKQDYTEKDTKVIFNKETFASCLEERQVPEGTSYWNECKKRCTPGWVVYQPASPAEVCQPCQLDPLFGDKLCRYNQFYVSELYWPVYQSRTYPGRAMGSFDPNGSYLSGQDKNSKLEYETVRKESYDRYVRYLKDFYSKVYEKEISEGELRAAFPKSVYLSADYTGRDLDGTSLNLIDTQPEHTLVYMTNGQRQLSRRMRPSAADNWKGFTMEDKCWFSTLPDPTKLAVSHSTYNEGHEEFTFAHMHQKINERNEVGPTRGSPYGSSMLDEGPSIKKIKESLDKEWKPKSGKQPKTTNNSMLGQYIEMNRGFYKKGLERIGAEEVKHLQDWLYHGFFRLYHSRNNNNMQDPLYAGIVSGFSFYTLNSLDNYGPNLSDGGERRPIYWSFYAGRPGLDGKAYAGTESNVGPSKVFSVDKIQVIYPTLNDGERGSSCFRPESLAQSEYFDKNKNSKALDGKVENTGFWGFRRDYQKELLDKGIDQAHNYVREVRIAYWIKRVNCHCSVCATNYSLGCSVLNTGDHPDDYFYGDTRTLENQDPILYPGGSIQFPDVVIRGRLTGAPNISHRTFKDDDTPGVELDSKLNNQNSPKNKSIPVPKSTFTYERHHGDLAISPEDLEYQLDLRPVADSIFESKKSTGGNLRKPVVPKNRVLKKNLTEPNARKIAMQEYGGHATDANAAGPKPGNGDDFEIAQPPGDQKQNLGPVSGGDDPLGSSGPGGVPSITPPPLGFTPPPQFDFPIICPFNPDIPGLNCSLQRSAFK